MTLWKIALCLAILAAAGCVSPKAATSTSTTSSTSSTTSPTQPSFAPIHLEHNYTTDSPASATFTIPNGTPALDVDVYVAGVGAAGAETCTQGPRLLVKTPSNQTFVDEQPSLGGEQGAFHCVEKKLTNYLLDAGTWGVTFSGSGPATGVIDIHLH